MKLRTIIGCLTVALVSGAAHGDFVFNVNQAVPEGNPVGLTAPGTVSGLPAGNTITGLTVTLNVSGGYNGGLYAYLEAPDNATVVLLNRPGVTGGNPFGYGGSGLNVVFFDAATQSLQDTPEPPGQVVTGNWQPVGRFSTFNGLDANGVWSLFIADDFAGGGQPVLNSWALDFTTAVVPEPDQVAAMALLGLVGLSLVATRRIFILHVKKKLPISPN